MRTLEDTNVKLQDMNQQLDKDLRESYEQQTFMNNMIRKLDSEIMSLRSLFQDQQEKLVFVQQHLYLINETIDEGDSTRKLLSALLESMPVSTPLLSSPQHITSPCTISPPYIKSPPLYIKSPRNASPSPLHHHSPIPKSPASS